MMMLALLSILTQFASPVAWAVTPTQSHPKITTPIVIKPRISPRPAPAPLATFTLAQAGKGKLSLSFQPSKPEWELDPRASLVIQLITDNEAFELDPSIIQRPDWPAGAKQITLTYKGAISGKPNLIGGGATFTVCRKKQQACKKMHTAISFSFTPSP